MLRILGRASGGPIDLGESMVQAAARETREETGIECEITGLVGIYTDPKHLILYTSNGEVRQEFSILLTAVATGGQPTPSSESSDVRWSHPRSSPAIRWTGRCGCGSAITWLAAAARRIWDELVIRLGAGCGQALLAWTRPTASRINGVARLVISAGTFHPRGLPSEDV